ncbi:hypothetical protein MMC16_003581 [Acarospora aff. strigata]|nr:hypothetical protein [Acarospora aff. strigata]
MADVRSLLRSERASRRINHPHATYSTTGTLVCLVCHIQLKSDSLWKSHLKSADHAMRLQRVREGTLGRPPGAPAPTGSANGTKKRKADGDELERPDRKKTRPVIEGVPADFFQDSKEIKNGGEIQEERVESETAREDLLKPTEAQTSDAHARGLPSNFFDASTKGVPSAVTTVDEDEWAAFERDVATPPPEASLPSALTATATISAAPLSAAELAARTTAEASTQKKELKEAELEGEKEDAARQLEDEFDQMEELENRVRRLRAKREELRQKREGGGATAQMDTTNARADNAVDNEEGTDDDDDDDDIEVGWGAFSVRQ